MLSDDICEVLETLWGAIQNYEYSEDYKDELVDAMTELQFIQYKLDNLKPDQTMKKEDIKRITLERWARRDCASVHES